jgi:hypothetical protein
LSVKISQKPCSYCGGLVAFHEDSVILRHIASQDKGKIPKTSQHIQCDPSVAQYINHLSFPPIFDLRDQYNKDKGNPNAVSIREEVFTEAWEHLQIKCGMTIHIG